MGRRPEQARQDPRGGVQRGGGPALRHAVLRRGGRRRQHGELWDHVALELDARADGGGADEEEGEDERKEACDYRRQREVGGPPAARVRRRQAGARRDRVRRRGRGARPVAGLQHQAAVSGQAVQVHHRPEAGHPGARPHVGLRRPLDKGEPARPGDARAEGARENDAVHARRVRDAAREADGGEAGQGGGRGGGGRHRGLPRGVRDEGHRRRPRQVQAGARAQAAVAADLRGKARPHADHPRQPSDGHHRRDGLRQDHAADAVLPRGGAREVRDDRVHAAAACRRRLRRGACERGDGRRVRRRGGLLDPFRGPDVEEDADQVHDGGHPAPRVAQGPDAERVLGRHHGRGARALPEHGHPLRDHEAGRRAAYRHEAHRHVRDHGPGEVRAVLRRRPDVHHQGQDVPGRELLQQDAGRGLRRGGGLQGAADPHVVPARRHPDLHDRAGGHRRHVHGAPRADEGVRVRAAAPRPPDLLAAALGAPGEDLQEVRGTQGHRRDKHRGDVADGRRHHLRHRPGVLQDEGVQPEDRHGRAASVPDLTAERGPAQGACGADGARAVLPAVHGERVPVRDAQVDRAGDPADEPVQHRPAAQVARHRRPPQVRVHGPAAAGEHQAVALPALGARRARQHGRADRPRAQDGRVPARPAAVQDAHQGQREPVRLGAAHHRLDAVRPVGLHPDEGERRAERCHAREVLRRRE